MTKKTALKIAARARQEANGGKYQHHHRQEHGPEPRPGAAADQRLIDDVAAAVHAAREAAGGSFGITLFELVFPGVEPSVVKLACDAAGVAYFERNGLPRLIVPRGAGDPNFPLRAALSVFRDRRRPVIDNASQEVRALAEPWIDIIRSRPNGTVDIARPEAGWPELPSVGPDRLEVVRNILDELGPGYSIHTDRHSGLLFLRSTTTPSPEIDDMFPIHATPDEVRVGFRVGEIARMGGFQMPFGMKSPSPTIYAMLRELGSGLHAAKMIRATDRRLQYAIFSERGGVIQQGARVASAQGLAELLRRYPVRA
ncbi:MAG TPA: hypothetical protein VGG39_06100 [Polyangiaceae bacterium]|jgi:hypothetical protein